MSVTICRHAADYVRAMHLMLQQPEPDDYVIAIGESHSLREFCELAFADVGLNWTDYVKIDEQFFRPAEVEHLVGDASKGRSILGWQAQYTFEGLVKEMVQSDLKELNESALTRR